MHGLNTYGLCARAVYEEFGEGEPKRVGKVGARFTSHVYPGERLETSMWRKGDGVYYESVAKERGVVAVKGVVEFNKI